MNGMNKHTFVVCAYKESPYLEECIRSLLHQSLSSRIILSTSTPNAYIHGIAEKYHIPVIVNEGESGITQDWNFAYAHGEAAYITIAHQDDVYEKDYLKVCIGKMEREKRPLIFFSDYGELRDGRAVKSNQLLRIKRIMLFPLRFGLLQRSRFVRRRILSFGDPICCPAVTFAAENLPKVIFNNHFRTNEDWEAWEKLSRCKGSFVYSKKTLVWHRIHEDSETSAAIKDTGRGAEDYEMYRKFWPKPIAKLFVKMYGKSEKSNSL